MAKVKEVVARAVAPGGTCVLNADDRHTWAMRGATRGRVVLFGGRSEEGGRRIEQHRAAGGRAAVVDNGMFRLWSDAGAVDLAPVSEVPLTFGGAALFQEENVLASAAAAHALGVSAAVIGEGLRSFVPSMDMNPGRMNLVRCGGVSILVDYAHNPASIEALGRFARGFAAERRLAVVGVPADRRDEDIRECGRLAACFDHVIARERDRPGPRPPGEVAALLVEGLADGGRRAPSVEVILSEKAAVQRILEMAEPGDLVVLLACDVDAVLDTVRCVAAVETAGQTPFHPPGV
jgi:cyanophycin synthetase